MEEDKKPKKRHRKYVSGESVSSFPKEAKERAQRIADGSIGDNAEGVLAEFVENAKERERKGVTPVTLDLSNVSLNRNDRDYLKIMVARLTRENFSMFKYALTQLPPREFVAAYLALMKFSIPFAQPGDEQPAGIAETPVRKRLKELMGLSPQKGEFTEEDRETMMRKLAEANGEKYITPEEETKEGGQD